MVQQLFILKLEPDLDPKPEKLCEHGASREDRLCFFVFNIVTLYVLRTNFMHFSMSKIP